MRTGDEITAEIKKVNTAKRNAERKRKRCKERLAELEKERRQEPLRRDTMEGGATK